MGPEIARRELARGLAACLLLPLTGGAQAFDLPELMSLLARRKSGEARFTEQRFVQGFDAPLESSGTLAFTAPDRFERRTLQPRAEAMVVDGNTLTLTRSGRSRQLVLDATPELQPLVEALRGTLSGNGAVLSRYFRSALSGSAEQWTLELRPLQTRIGESLRSLRLAGRRDELVRVEMDFAGGDRSVMTIVPRAAPGPASSP
ncbi:outer membrane lipoprotein carrier protein LolA [uncultured Methylibium sp.]|uniref:LolA family protein n=1 Tax=uncultured Methylibium sp. TaxID=381093 RepID=UPI0025F36A49|nr:outer membrane lipoprotein carrier protein LolA [uncultured Methylibium sp.]